MSQGNNKYRVSGAFFENTKGNNGPAFSGFVEIDGVKTHIALWPKTSAAGNNYLQVSEDKKAPGAQGPVAKQPGQFQPRMQQAPVRPTARPMDDDEDEIPFAPEVR